jgi:hypothetical protein
MAVGCRLLKYELIIDLSNKATLCKSIEGDNDLGDKLKDAIGIAMKS